MHKAITILGNACMCLGLLSAILCAIPGMLFPAIGSGFLGFVTTSVYIGLNTRYQVNQKKLNPGMIGLLLNSIPLLFVLALQLYIRFNK